MQVAFCMCVCVCLSLPVYTTQNPNIFIFLATSVIYCECDGQQKHCGCDWCDWQQEQKVQVALKARRLEDWAITTERRQPPFKEAWQRQTSKPKKISSLHHRERRVNNQQSQWKGPKSKNIHDINFCIHCYLKRNCRCASSVNGQHGINTTRR